MIVGLIEVELYIKEAITLKDKRAVVKSLVEKTKAKFNVSVAQVGFLENRQRATLGMAFVSNEVGHVNSVLDKLESFLEQKSQADIISIRREVI